ncbi:MULTISPECIES: choice-of-anchor M domain-containing protein [Gardnerella]|uniref:choice-of-anchor M domain-containing protein n=1 Tax=Gardnerella TaxID=2701 RepID=UPI000DD62B37|nr:choice-of-anchor M domain-containing protein [Gardnerella leopoldii]NSX42507.1 cell surface protein [Gardnerella vaginalis]NSX45234.1 cell surface protein [Gardnerella vaginalis]RIY28675.1 cell surface protein [Bifidobacteriaceae bacterium GH005]
MNYKQNETLQVKRKHAYSTALLALIFSLVTLVASLCAPNPMQETAYATEGNQPVMIQAGHADFGPTLIDGKWKLKIRDDTGDEPVWRDPENVVFKLGGNSIIPMPDDAAYSFIGEKPGTKLYVIPQTQNPDVPWLGWNTQEGGVLNELDRGANLSLEGVSGPGKLHVYLENGNNNPQQLWDSTKGYPQNSWIETNAHTHVNWVFSKPGIYHVKLTFSGKLKNGRAVSDTRVLNFAVGDNTDPNAALGAGAAAGASGSEGDEEDQDEEDNDESTKDETNNHHKLLRNQHKHSHKVSEKSDDTALVLQIVGIFVAIIAVIIVIFVLIVVAKSKKARNLALAKQVSAQANQQYANNANFVNNANGDSTLSNLVRDQETTVMSPINNSQYSQSDNMQSDGTQWK